MESEKINFCEFLSVCIEITNHAGNIIKELSSSNKLNTQYKGKQKIH